METQTEISTKNKNMKIERFIGILLLIPPILSILLFLLNLFFRNIGNIPEMSNLSSEWTGYINYSSNGGGGGYMSATPIYLGLMAIAGAILLKGTDKKD